MPAVGCDSGLGRRGSSCAQVLEKPPAALIHALFRKADPHRAPDWAWHWAAWLLQTQQRPDPTWDVPFVEAAVKYQRLLRDDNEVDLAESMPVLHRARRIHTTARMLRWELESRILAREPFSAIAEKCSVVTGRYRLGETVGTIGVIGPTRMDYARVMCLVAAMAEALNRPT